MGAVPAPHHFRDNSDILFCTANYRLLLSPLHPTGEIGFLTEAALQRDDGPRGVEFRLGIIVFYM